MRVYQDAINQVHEQWKDSEAMRESIRKIVWDDGLVNSTMNIVVVVVEYTLRQHPKHSARESPHTVYQTEMENHTYISIPVY